MFFSFFLFCLCFLLHLLLVLLAIAQCSVGYRLCFSDAVFLGALRVKGTEYTADFPSFQSRVKTFVIFLFLPYCSSNQNVLSYLHKTLLIFKNLTIFVLRCQDYRLWSQNHTLCTQDNNVFPDRNIL